MQLDLLTCVAQSSRTCIDGHRSPTCIHLNRILVQVRQPGRPKHRCVHARPSEGIHRCTNCFPLVAYVVPGHSKSIPDPVAADTK